MVLILDIYGLWALVAAFAVMLFAGFAKGVVGFALPMIAVSGVGSIMSAEMAIVSILLPGLITNIWQAFRTGLAPALESLRAYWRMFVVMLPVLAGIALMFTRMSDGFLFVVMGTIVLIFAAVEIIGLKPAAFMQSRSFHFGVGAMAGITGGLGGLWGPPIMIYLLIQGVPKQVFVRTMGLVFFLGAIVLNGAHIASGVLNTSSAPFSAFMILPALLGMWLGMKVQDRLDQVRFKRAILFVLVLAGLNLLRRGLMV